MNFENIRFVYFIGIGGIGMSALARYFNSLGKTVSGYDKMCTALTDELVQEGIFVHFKDDTELISFEIKNSKPEVLVIYTPAVSKEHRELNYFIKND